MPTEKTSPKLNRRKFLATAAIAGAAGSVPPATAALAATTVQPEQRLPSALPPNAHVAAAETGTPQAPPAAENGPPGSDFMVDVIKTLDIKYLPANPASSYRGMHESLINYGKNTMPEFLTCMHEESSVAMCHGYFKATGKPLMTLVHGVVGLQHATMAVYNAWCDRVPVLIFGGNDLDAAHRAPGVPTFHSGAGHQRDRARLHQVGRHSGFAAAFRGKLCPHVQDRDHAALWPGDDGARRRLADRAGPRFRSAALHPEILRRPRRRRAISPRCGRRRAFSPMPNGRSSWSTARRERRTASIFWSSSPNCSRRRWSTRATA